MKNAILCLLASAAVSLSLAFRVAPPQAPVTQADLIAAEPGTPPAAAERVVLPATSAFRDTLFSGYYSQLLNAPLTPQTDKSLVATMVEWLGTPYRSGGSTQKGTDCSGFVMRLYQQVYGVTLVHSSGGLFQATERVKKDALQEGDLVFFRRSSRSPIYHVGVYLGGGKFIHSASGQGVTVSSLADGYWHRNFYAAGRVAEVAATHAPESAVAVN